jgi:hypothetical protein
MKMETFTDCITKKKEKVIIENKDLYDEEVILEDKYIKKMEGKNE